MSQPDGERDRRMMDLNLAVLQGTFALCRLDPHAPVPDWATAEPFFSITRTEDELSIVCVQENVPPDVRSERGWACLKVEGPLDFSLTGVLAGLAAPLADAGIPIFALSTYDTDYLLVKEVDRSAAVDVLEKAGNRVRSRRT